MRLTDKYHGGVPTDRFQSVRSAVSPAQIAKRHERRVLAKRAKEYMEFRRANPGYTPPTPPRYKFHDPQLKRMANVALGLRAVMSYLKQHAGSAPSTPASAAVEYWTNTLNNRLWFTDYNGVSGQVGTPTGEYNVQDYGVLPANAAATNVTNLNTLLQTTAPSGSMIFFPPGLYQLNAALTALTKDFAFQGVRNQSTLAWVSPVTTTNLITVSPSGYYTSFRDLIFQTFSTMTSNYVIECGNNVNTFVESCTFTGGATTPFAGCLSFSTGGNGAVVRGCYFSGWTGTGINCAGTLASPFFSDIEMIGNALSAGHSAIGVSCPNGGAILMADCGIVLCGINVSLVAGGGQVVASVFAINCFLDQGITQSLLISGAGTVVRCHFVACWFTLSSAGSSAAAVQIATTGSSIQSGIEFQDCWIVNVSGATGTTNGVLVTAASDFTIANCQISGWTNGINVTPSTTANTCAPVIQGNTIGPTGGAAGNTTGIVLNVGAPTTYANILISNNALGGNTTPLTDNSTSATTAFKLITNNGGLLTARVANYTATTIPLTTVTNVDSRGGMFFPANTRPSTVRITVYATNAATIQTLTATVRFGTNNSNADTAVFTQAFTAGTAALGSGTFVFEVDLETATAMGVGMRFYNGNNAATGIAANISLYASLSAAATVATTANSWLGVYFSSATAAAITIRSVKYEIVSQ